MRGGWTTGAQRALGLGVLVALAGCVSPSTPPPPPPPAPPPVARPAPPVSADWRDAPLTAGAWTYAARAGGSEARFGPAGAAPLFAIRCDAAQRRVVLLPVQPTASITITTSSAVRAFPVQPSGATLSATDSFLDAMAFSRGRFVVASAGTASLYIPAWPEFARVVEDCRG